jgi:hypothetical protein
MASEIDNIKIGDYVLASRWSDRGWNDPWAVGYVTAIASGYLQVGKEDGSPSDSVNRYRHWSHAIAITAAQGSAIIAEYVPREGTKFDPDVLARILGQQGATNQEKVIKIWEFDDAPIEYQQLSENGGDEGWVALVIGYGDETPLVVEQISSGLFSVDRYSVSEGIVYIGAHA